MEDFIYKAKRKDTSEWIEGFYYNIQGKEHYLLVPCALGVAHIEIIPETKCVYFGLKDTNENRVFLGDILCEKYEDSCEDGGFGYCYNEVVFIGGAFGIIGEITGELIPFSEYPITNQYVAGNIYDNKELLNNNESRN